MIVLRKLTIKNWKSYEKEQTLNFERGNNILIGISGAGRVLF